jgi:hypothetical protein
MAERDWYSWHDAYDRPGSPLIQRLAAVQKQIGYALDTAPSGPLRAVSLCAGQGRDLIGVLARHPRGQDVTARLVELDPRNAQFARDQAARAGLGQVEVVTGDASLTDQYTDLVPADVVVMCGVFGNMTDADVRRTVGYCGQLTAERGVVVWTRARWAPDLVPEICDWFTGRGFKLLWLSSANAGFGVGAHRFMGTPEPLAAGARMFSFTGHREQTGPVRG